MGHLEDVKQSYFRHMIDALQYSVISFIAGSAFCVHAFLPDVFQQTGSTLIHYLDDVIIQKKKKLNIK